MQPCWPCEQRKTCRIVEMVVRNANDQEDLLSIDKFMCKDCRSYMPLLFLEDKTDAEE